MNFSGNIQGKGESEKGAAEKGGGGDRKRGEVVDGGREAGGRGRKEEGRQGGTAWGGREEEEKGREGGKERIKEGMIEWDREAVAAQGRR